MSDSGLIIVFSCEKIQHVESGIVETLLQRDRLSVRNDTAFAGFGDEAAARMVNGEGVGRIRPGKP